MTTTCLHKAAEISKAECTVLQSGFCSSFNDSPRRARPSELEHGYQKLALLGIKIFQGGHKASRWSLGGSGRSGDRTEQRSRALPLRCLLMVHSGHAPRFCQRRTREFANCWRLQSRDVHLSLPAHFSSSLMHQIRRLADFHFP